MTLVSASSVLKGVTGMVRITRNLEEFKVSAALTPGRKPWTHACMCKCTSPG